jgi:hypothetical protein
MATHGTGHGFAERLMTSNYGIGRAKICHPILANERRRETVLLSCVVQLRQVHVRLAVFP